MESENKNFKISEGRPVRVLYSFPLRIGAGRVATTAWYQVKGLVDAGADVTIFPAASSKPLPAETRPTLARGKLRIPNRLLGRLAYGAWHDRIAARRLEAMPRAFDIVHTWPIGALETLKTARRIGLPTVLERCNAHTRFAYDVVNRECERIGVPLPAGHEHAWNRKILSKEEQEYRQTFRLLCPSDFVVKSFLAQGFAPEKLVRHIYGFDETMFFPENRPMNPECGLTTLFAGVCAVRKGLHYALEAWLKSSACRDGTFLIAGEFLPAYEKKLSQLLAHPRVKKLGRRNDLPELMRASDILVLPTVEEGSALVTYEARGSGCVLLVSEAAGAVCEHMSNALVHPVGDVATLAQHFTMLADDRSLLERFRIASLNTANEITWTAASRKLLAVYREVIAAHQNQDVRVAA
ncbi:MAG TPA: glycosyltransferase family 4 protein [Verrucomicrobiae bacterium]|nr:glycosyltransferase family 4 protein [Verrucomicrobiae bacterium]